MLQYIYKPSEAGLSEWPSGTLRLDGIDVTDNPNEADVFVYPGALFNIKNRFGLEELPYFKVKESQHVFFHCSDHEVLYNSTAIIIRCNTRDWYLAKDPNTISWPWPVEDYRECMEFPAGGFKYDVSFQGWEWSDVRKASIASCQNSPLKCDISTYSDFFGYLQPTDPEFSRRRSEFRRSMKESRIALCPESIPGVFPYRFFEAMSAARVPFLIGSHYVLPFADEIPYDKFCVWCPAENSGQASSVARKVLSRMSDSEFIEAGKLARYWWEKLLDSRQWPQLMAYAVKQKLGISLAA